MSSKKSHYSTTFAILSLVFSMLLLSFAAVPIYNLFCKATGFGGTTQRQTIASTTQGSRQITVHFDANVDKNLPWRFVAKNQAVKLITGQNILVFYESTNLSDQDIIGTAVYNITPLKAGKYFVKIHCFCFEEQLLKAGQQMLMPVSFYIDPAIEDDPEMQDVYNITLSYSFFKIR